MESFAHHTDDTVLARIGDRLGAARLGQNLTQAALATESGVSKRTIERLEAGRSIQLTNFIRVLRALGHLDRLDVLLPPSEPGPMELLRREGRTPRRARRNVEADGSGPWTWRPDEA